MQGLVLVALGGASLSLWGVGVASPLRQNALDFLLIKALGAPATLLLMVAQVLLLNPFSCLSSVRKDVLQGQLPRCRSTALEVRHMEHAQTCTDCTSCV